MIKKGVSLIPFTSLSFFLPGVLPNSIGGFTCIYFHLCIRIHRHGAAVAVGLHSTSYCSSSVVWSGTCDGCMSLGVLSIVHMYAYLYLRYCAALKFLPHYLALWCWNRNERSVQTVKETGGATAVNKQKEAEKTFQTLSDKVFVFLCFTCLCACACVFKPLSPQLQRALIVV